MRHVAEKLSETVRAMQTETEQTLFAMKSVKLGRTLKGSPCPCRLGGGRDGSDLSSGGLRASPAE